MEHLKILYKILLSIIIIIISVLSVLALVILMLMAQTGGDVISSGFSENGTTLMVLAYALSAGWLGYIIIGILAVLLISVWGDDILLVGNYCRDTLKIIIHGARKELKSEKEQPPEQKEKKD